uniref:Ig-like domain-containing protein n=1 Tax=Angiostrongylus cantonensis TaxID=6313 RepID=A0A0K0DQ78_ANGCA
MLGRQFRLLWWLAILAAASAAKRKHRQTYIQITVYPSEAQVREGREVVFDCRARIADNSFYPPTRWTKVGGPLPPHAYESSGRLTIKPVSLSDSGQYACVSTHEGRTVEARTTLHVQSYGPQEKQNLLPPSGQCMADERACANNECVKADYICDGEPDCRDRSDELNCPTMRQCEPNEFKSVVKHVRDHAHVHLQLTNPNVFSSSKVSKIMNAGKTIISVPTFLGAGK